MPWGLYAFRILYLPETWLRTFVVAQEDNLEGVGGSKTLDQPDNIEIRELMHLPYLYCRQV
jgi:hypothetical protein